MLITSITLFIALRKFSMDRIGDVETNTDAQILLDQNDDPDAKTWTKERVSFVSNIAIVIAMISIIVASGFRPSVPGGIYYLVYIGMGTWWACYRSFTKPFAVISRFVMVLLVLHMGALLTYQNPWPQEFLDWNSTVAR